LIELATDALVISWP